MNIYISQDAIEQNKRNQRELAENIEKLASSLASMQSKFNTFEGEYEEARIKAETEAANATELTSNVRVPVTKWEKHSALTCNQTFH